MAVPAVIAAAGAAGGTAATAGGTAAAGTAAAGTAAAAGSSSAGTLARVGGKLATSGQKVKNAYDKLPSNVKRYAKNKARDYAEERYHRYQEEKEAERELKGINPVRDEDDDDDSVYYEKKQKSTLRKVGCIGCLGCGCMAPFASLIIGLLGAILVPYVVVSWFSTFFDLEKTANSTLASCQGCTTEELQSIRERQWHDKLEALEKKYGSKIDVPAIIATVSYSSNLEDLITLEYDNNYNENDWTNQMSKDVFSGLWNLMNGDAGNDFGQYSTENISLLQYIAEGMASSGSSYSDENYREWLINGNQNIFTSNMLYCSGASALNTVKNFFAQVANNTGIATERFFVELDKGRIPLEYFTHKAAGDILISSTVGSYAYYWRDGFNYIRICEYGYIEGMISGITKISDETEKQKAKEKIADEIIDLAEYYRYADEIELGTTDCTYVGETGDYTGWKQCDPTWGSISLGGSSSICSIGCLATSISIQIAKSGTKITNLPSGFSEFNPGAFVTSIGAHGGFSGGGMTWTGWGDIAPNMRAGYFVAHAYDENQEAGLAKELNDVLNEAEEGKYQRYVVLQIKHSQSAQHWVAVEGIDGNTVKINDPGSEGTTLSENYDEWHVYGYRVIYATDVPFGGSGTSSPGTGGGKVDLDYNSARYKDRLENLPDYNQCGEKLHDKKLGNSNVCTSGCMVASLAAIQYMFTGTPTDVDALISDMMEEGEWSNAAAGMGTPYFDTPSNSPLITEKWGLSGETLNSSDKNKIKENIISSLKAGKKILLNLGGAKSTYSTSGGHFLMLDHYNESTKKIYIFNPANSGTGYITEDELMKKVLAYNKYGPWAISSNRVNAENACDTTGGGDLDKLIELLGRLEGIQDSCTVRGQEGYKSYVDSMDQNYAGKTTSFGITQVYNKELAASLGYTQFDSDMSAGCAEKKYIDEMAKISMEERVESVKAYYEEKSGGKSLKEYQYHSLALISHQWPVGVRYVIDELVNVSDLKSYEVYNIYLKYNGLGGAQGGLNRREAEYHLFYNGNYDLERVFDAQNTEAYWKKRVAVYESE